MGCVVIIGSDYDICAQLVQERLAQLGREVVYLNETNLLPGLNFVWELSGKTSQGRVGPAGFAQIDGVLARFFGVPVSPARYETKDGQYISAEWHALVQGWLHSLPCPVVNRLRPELWYKARLSSPHLLALAPGIKFKLPRTRITTSIADAEAFYADVADGLCYSPLSHPSNYVIEDRESFTKLKSLSGLLPFALTEKIAGASLRVVIIGQEAIVVPSIGVELDKLPPQIKAHCLELATILGLSFCELDLNKTMDDDWYCLGVDCAPNLFWHEDQLKQEIVEHLVAMLTPTSEGEIP